MAYVKVGITKEDCIQLSTRLRDEDIKEVLASRPNVPISDSLFECVQVSYKTFAVMEDDVGCIAIFGARKAEVSGIPWLLTSELLFGKSCRKFIRQCKSYFKELTDDFEYSYNYVSSTNLKAHHWLTWMGFTLDKSTSYTLNGVVFYPFSYVRNNNV